ncbi:MAG: hydrogenase expression/formation protein HypC [Rhodothermales bacterium]|jgi:hydrogenase expression/formation protein HypC
MCLAIPGKVLSIRRDDELMPTGRVAFGGITRQVNLAFTPEAQADDYVLVHVGFAISVIDEDAAGRIFDALEEMGAVEELPPGIT